MGRRQEYQAVPWSCGSHEIDLCAGEVRRLDFDRLLYVEDSLIRKAKITPEANWPIGGGCNGTLTLVSQSTRKKEWLLQVRFDHGISTIEVSPREADCVVT